MVQKNLNIDGPCCLSLQPQRVTSDLKLARELAAKLDAEKGVAENPLLVGGDANGAQANGASASAMEDGSPVSGGEEAPPAAGREEGEEESAEEQVR